MKSNRARALELAVEHAEYDATTEQAVADAEKFLTFLDGPKGGSGTAPIALYDYYVDEYGGTAENPIPLDPGAYPEDTYVRRFPVGAVHGEYRYGQDAAWLRYLDMTRSKTTSMYYAKVEHANLPTWAQ